MLPPSGLSFITRLDGARMADVQELFEVFSRELHLPAYFGWNWEAFSECMRDLSWVPASHYLIVVENSSRLLIREPEERESFFVIMREAGKQWRNILGVSEKVSFNVVLL